MRRTALLTTILACFLSVMFEVSTFADELFLSPIVGSNPGITIAGVASGGAPWVVRHGTAILTDEGRLRIDVRGLILPSTGNTGPVSQVAASVVCSDAVAASTAAVNLSTDGNAEIRARVALPSSCLGAVILIRIAGINNSPLPAPGPFIAATGLAQDRDNNNN